jgi:hypothetical protein
MNIFLITALQLSNMMSERSASFPAPFFSDHISLFFYGLFGIYQVPARSILGLLKEGILRLVLQTITHHGELLEVEGAVLSELLGCAPSEYLTLLEAVIL